MKLIVNADDCGYSRKVNQHIEQAIIKGRISSTTIMANMDDFEGAIRLYQQYKDTVSFGFHVNLTEGTPLRYSQRLLDMGFYQETDGKIVFNAQPYRRKMLTKSVREEIFQEVLAQGTKIREAGVMLSHIDGHHFIHQSIFMLPVLPKLCKAIDVHKIRTYRNYMHFSINRILRNRWKDIIRLHDSKAVFTDWFTSYSDFLAQFNSNQIYYRENDTIELMCHPGGIYESEEKELMSASPEERFNCKLINYNTL